MEATTRTGWPARLGAVLASPWALPVLTLTAAATSLLVQRAIYPGLSWNRDEAVYLWQVDVLRAGQLSTSDGGHPALFQPWLSAARDGSLFSQYTLGWPLVLLLGAVLGSTDLGVAAGAALAVAGTGAFVTELTRDRHVATIAAALMVLSPIFAVQAGVHLNYLFTVGLGLLALTAALRGARRQRPSLLVASGALLGWVFLTRPFDAVVWGLLAAAPLAIEHRARVRAILGWAGWATLGLAPLVVMTFLLNRHLTGSATEFPITVADPLDQFWFGTRRLMPGFDLIEYTPRLALSSTGRNAFWLPFFLAGAHLGLITAALGAWHHRHQRSVNVLIGLGLAFPVAYFAFFGTHISSLTARLSGPIYYIPAYPALCALMALALAHLGRRRPGRALVLVAALVLITVPATVSRLTVNRDLSQANQPWGRSVEALQGRALVVTSPPGYLLFLNPFGHNGADLDGRILFATDGGPELLEVVDDHPDRTPYLQRANRSVTDLLPSEHPRQPEVVLTRMELLRGNVRLTGTVASPAGAPAVVHWLELDGSVVGNVQVLRTRGVDAPAARRHLDVELDSLDLPIGLHTLEVKVGAGADEGDAARSPVVRRTFYVRVGPGEVTLLAPGTAARMVLRPGAPAARWEDVLTLPELVVDARIGAAG